MFSNQKIQFFKGVGEKRAKLFAKIGIKTAGDLITRAPRRYEDWSRIYSVAGAAELAENCCIKITVTEPPFEKRIGPDRYVYNGVGYDGENYIKIVIWGSGYSASRLILGKTYLLFGRVVLDGMWGYTISSPAIDSPVNAKIRPVYGTVNGLSRLLIEKTAAQAVELLLRDNVYTDFLSDDERERFDLIPRRKALCDIHFPPSMESAGLARRRLAFDELSALMIAINMMGKRRHIPSGIVVNGDYTRQFLKNLPFSPTSAQVRVTNEIAADFESGLPMNRLLEGDVGSGKTAVAAAACFAAVKSGYQAALLAPTEILARQHFETLKGFFEGMGITTRLLTGGIPQSEKKRIKKETADGECGVLVGTHAVLTGDVVYKNLGLAVADEQHRFGVAQRAALSAKGNNPHVLLMSATPIPRTLALMLYGDLTLSVLDEFPKNKAATHTYCVSGGYRRRAFNFIKKLLDEGGQGYIICPAVDDDPESELKSVQKYYSDVQAGVFKEYGVGLIHGKMTEKHKTGIMEQFLSGEIKLMIATTVVEVGIDVKNACVMLIENAERFGLSQLHQLRGRIGRGNRESYCILMSDNPGGSSAMRLKIMTETTDGFKIAEEDLRLRGAGDFLGQRQSGVPSLRIADLASDTALIQSALELSAEISRENRRDGREELFVMAEAMLKNTDVFGG